MRSESASYSVNRESTVSRERSFAEGWVGGPAAAALLVGDCNGRKNGQTFDGQRNMRQVGNGAMAVLKVESVEKLLRLLLADFPQRLFHRECRARVLGHGVGLDFRLDAVHR